VTADVQALLQKFSAILRTGDVKPTQTHAVERHIHTGSHPLFSQNPAGLIQKSCKSPKQNLKG
jgi:hypothetical protein